MDKITKCIIAETERLILRRFHKHDLSDLYEYLSDAETVKFEPYRPMTLSEVISNLDWRIYTPEMIAVEMKNQTKLIGNIYLGNRGNNIKELGFVFNRKYWNQGHAKESCQTIIELEFSKGTN